MIPWTDYKYIKRLMLDKRSVKIVILVFIYFKSIQHTLLAIVM